MKEKLSPEDLRLWQNQLRDVKPLSKTKKIPLESPKPKVRQKPQPLSPPLQKPSHPLVPLLPLQDISKRELRHLKIEGRLDMHGMTQEEAYHALENFLLRSQERGLKFVLIITGKGCLSSENTLRHQLPRWVKDTALTRLVSILHYPAKPQDGGQGAYYIGVRRRKKG